MAYGCGHGWLGACVYGKAEQSKNRHFKVLCVIFYGSFARTQNDFFRQILVDFGKEQKYSRVADD
jgi:hypothetical protein